MSWVTTWRMPPPHNKTISVRFGNSVCFAAYKPILDKWVMVAGGREEEIAAPSLWWCENILPALVLAESSSPSLPTERVRVESRGEARESTNHRMTRNNVIDSRGGQNFMRRSRKPKQQLLAL